MLLSIIIPAYNASSTIDATLQSIENQVITPPNQLRRVLAAAGVSPDSDFEIIVVDNGSTDDTAAVVRRHAASHSQIRLIQQANGGVSSARNAGIEVAQGEYLHFIDADDLLFDGAYARIVALLAARRPDVLRFGCSIVKEDEIEDECGRAEGVEIEILYDGAAGNDTIGIVVTDCFYRRSTIAGCLQFDDEVRIAEDTVFLAQYYVANLEAHKMRIQLPVYMYVQREGSLWNSKDRHSSRNALQYLWIGYERIAQTVRPCSAGHGPYARISLHNISVVTLSRILRCRCSLRENRRMIKRVKQLNIVSNLLSKKVRLAASIVFANAGCLTLVQRIFPALHSVAVRFFMN